MGKTNAAIVRGQRFRVRRKGYDHSAHGPQSKAVYLRELRAAAESAEHATDRPHRTVSGVLCVEGEPTGDARMIEKGACRWDSLPLPLRYVGVDEGEHKGAEVVGHIATVERDDSSGKILMTGLIFTDDQAGRDAVRDIEEKMADGVSVDLDDVSFEYRVAGEIFGIGEDEQVEVQGDPDDVEAEVTEDELDENGMVTIMTFNAGDDMEVMTDCRIRAATMVAIPAFEGARLTLDPGGETGIDPPPAPDEEEEEEYAAATGLAASGFPVDPPGSWFSDPRLTGPTPVSVGQDGRVYGHIAVWGTCHTGIAGECTTPPRSTSDYAYFRTGSVLTREGSEIAVGRLTMDTRHAAARSGPAATMRHYDHTGTAVADVTAGEDEFGIWVAGAVRPEITQEQARVLRSSPISGDWRRIGTSLELVAALAVNVPGFPVPRVQGLVAGAAMQTLVAAGMLAPRKVRKPGRPDALSNEDLRYLKALAHRESTRQAEELATMSRKVRASALAQRVRAHANVGS